MWTARAGQVSLKGIFKGLNYLYTEEICLLGCVQSVENQLTLQSSVRCQLHADLLLGLLFNPGNKGDMFL
jgi:hypothetical protein